MQRQPLSAREKLGYAMGDLACQLGFSLVGSYLSMYYTDILGLKLAQIGVLMLVARIWDAINDPLWGGFIDRRVVAKNGAGKFRPWLLRLAAPVALGSVLMFLRFPGLRGGGLLVWAYAGYILYGMLYTGVNIPYGSLASVISAEEKERSALSVFRSIGAGVGALPAAVLLPLFVYSTNAQGEKFLDYARFFPAVCVMAIASALIFVLSYKLTREHVAPPAAAQKPELRRTLCVLLRNRPFWILCLASMLLIGLTLYMQTINGYLFKDYFKAPNLLSLYAVFTYLPMVLLLPVLGKLAHRFGKKELCAAGALLSATVNLAAFFAKIHDSGTYLIVQFISGLGMSFFTLEVWALVTDVIDHQERLSGQREEGTVYAFYSFTRKLGHTLAGSGGAWALARIGYKVAERGLPPPVQDPNAIAQMYSVATAAPAVFFLLMFALLAFAYPLSKRKLASLAQKI